VRGGIVTHGRLGAQMVAVGLLLGAGVGLALGLGDDLGEGSEAAEGVLEPLEGLFCVVPGRVVGALDVDRWQASVP
jgi:hypothetical protein